MVAAFSAPILSVAADAVRDLEGRDALFGLWTVFTKCKQSLHNGARLENITWRLWHCERNGPEKLSQMTKENDTAEADTPTSPQVQLPPTPSASYNIFPTQTSPADFTQHPIASDAVLSVSEVYSAPYYSLSYPQSDNATQAASSDEGIRTSRAVGRIICDFLPTKRDVDQPSSVDQPTDVPSWSPEAPASIYQSHPKTTLLSRCAMRPSTIILPETGALPSCLPTPDTPYLGLADREPSITRTATQSPSQLLNVDTVVHSTPGLPSEPPRLVVVKPTPSPTPQPTPPTTPLIITPVTTMQGSRSHWLSLPLTRDPISQPECEEQNIVGIDHADIWTLQMKEHDTDGLSASSIASKGSECSHTTTTSVAWMSTTSASSIGYQHDEGEKRSDMIGTTMGYTHVVGNLPVPTLHRRGSLSTVQSISTDRGRKEAVPSRDIGAATKYSASGVNADDDEGQQGSIKKGKPSTGSRASSSSRKRAKRNSAPVSLAPMPYPHVDQFLHHSLAAPISTEKPTTPEYTSERPTNSNSAMNGDDHSSGQSRSRESSATGSRSRSREHSGNPFADLSGIGTLGGYTIAAAYPPPNMTVRKQVAVGAGKGKVKLAFGRGLGGKSRAVRRNSAGSTVEVGAKEKDNARDHGSDANLERVKSEENQPSRLEDILEKPTIHQRIKEPQEGPPQVTLIHEEKVPQDSIPTAAAKQATPHAALPKRYAELLTIGGAIQSIKRQPRFNIGSNSDDGSAVASNCAGSGSSQSGDHSLGQRSGKMIENSQQPKPRVMNERTPDTLLSEERERQRREDEAQQLQVQQRQHHNHPEPLQPPVPQHNKPTKQESRHSKATQHTHNIHLTVLERVQLPGRVVSDKVKGKPKAVDHHPPEPTLPALSSKPSSKTKSKSTPNLGSLDAVLAAKVRDSLGEPLLPKGRPVVVDMETEYDTETEDGTWSDEDVIDQTEAQKQIKELQLERERQAAELKEQELLLQQIYLQQQQNLPRHGGRPAGVQRTHSSHYPAPNNARTNKSSTQRNRNQNQQIRELALHHAKLEQAAKEAQRQRDMIQKLPRESFQDLAKARANSVGLLSQLLKPNNPEGLPPDHPHRVYSSGLIQATVLPPMPAMQPTTSDPGPGVNPKNVNKVVPNGNSQPTPAPPNGGTRPLHPRRHASTDEGRRRIPSWSRILSPIRGPPLQPTKSSAALPVSSQVQAGSVIANGSRGTPSAAVASSRILGNNLTMTSSGGYRPKGPPKGQEMEEDSGSEPETEKIQISKSIAEQKLKALVEKRGIRQHQAVVSQPQPSAGSSKVAPPADEDVPDWARVSQPERQPERQRRLANDLQLTPAVRPPPSAPIPLGLPYKLPLPAPPTTPRTTRRQMLSTELSESLRRNLLWERQVSKTNLAAMRRSSSGVTNRHDGLGRMQPFTSIAPVVQLHAKGTIPLEQQEDPAKRAAAPMTDTEREEMRKHAIARNRSWANDFHYAGW